MKVIILAGGEGLRLFPLSREVRPKSFLRILGEETLLQQTVKRFLPLVNAEDITIMTQQEYFFHVRDNLLDIGATAAKIICEPVGRDTAPAVALALSFLQEEKFIAKDEPVLITFANLYFKEGERFDRLLDKIIKTQYSSGNIYKLEKMSMLLLSKESIFSVFERNVPQLFNLMKNGYEALRQEFSQLESLSLGEILEKEEIKTLSLNNLKWQDINSFDAIYDALCDEEGNAIVGDTILENCRRTMILGGERLISAIDVEDIMVVDTPDVLLISKKGSSESVKTIVNRLKKEKRSEVETGVTVHRPWGAYTILSEGEGYKVKKITINPKAAISLQMHYHRSEHWTVIAGTGRLTVDDKIVVFRENESAYIPIGAKHRLENIGKIPLSIIEVQNGKYLGEDDIVRFEDVYGRT